MPVFETGAFNHSATCPAARNLLGTGCFFNLRIWKFDAALRPEKCLEQRPTFIGENAGTHLGSVVQTRVPKQVSDGAAHARLFIPGAEHDALHPREHSCPGAHGTRLEGDVEGAVVESPPVKL